MLYLLRLVWDAFAYIGRTVLDLFMLVRVALMRRAQRRFPDRSPDYAQHLTAAREAQNKRWGAWHTLPVRRRVEVRMAILAVLALVAIWLSPHDRLFNAEETGRVEGEPQHSALSAQTEQDEFAIVRAAFRQQLTQATAGQWLLYPGALVSRGRLNDWDDFKVGSPVVIDEGGSGRTWYGVQQASRYRMWYRGCHFVAHEYTCGVGHATSADGIVWEKLPAPVFLPADAGQRERLDAIAVVRTATQYFMWYAVKADWRSGIRNATLHLATSQDGLEWAAAGPVLRAVTEGTWPLDPAALYDGRLFHLWYVDRTAPASPLALLHVTSSDGLRWQTAGSTALRAIGLDDSTRRVWVSSVGNGYLGYFSPRFQQPDGVVGFLRSADGHNWTREQSNTPVLTGALKSRGDADSPMVIATDDGLQVWLVIRPADGAEAIGFLYRKKS